ncbi:hypothetical protein PINS_up019966 [Pythium insidiosum]|nr:hypothetical protein PINS_up019966 [Pythium insidiosum]
MLRHLLQKQEEGENIQTHFSLADNVYAKATVDSSVGKVCIWLGQTSWSNTRTKEALELLEGNVKIATERLSNSSRISFLRDQIITTEVNIARIFNHDVRRTPQGQKDESLVAELEAK